MDSHTRFVVCFDETWRDRVTIGHDISTLWLQFELFITRCPLTNPLFSLATYCVYAGCARYQLHGIWSSWNEMRVPNTLGTPSIDLTSSLA
jgi:hypothetical protein